MSLELKPEKVKPYLKLITEAIVQLNDNRGSLRKDIWDYLYKKYDDNIDYRDFLLAIRKFRLDGKMQNDEGIYTMHKQVLNEVREKTPTPVFSSKFSTDVKKPNMFISMMSTQQKNKGVSSQKEEAKISSKISNLGKQQKIKGRMFNLGGARQIEKTRVREEHKVESSTERKGDVKGKLGF